MVRIQYKLSVLQAGFRPGHIVEAAMISLMLQPTPISRIGDEKGVVALVNRE